MKVFIDSIDEEGNIKQIECIGKQDLEAVCIQENIHWFTQTNDTPPMHAKVIEAVGYSTTGNTMNEILEGTFIAREEWDKYLNIVCKCLLIPDKNKIHPKEHLEISLEEHIHGWQRQNEKISSDPKGLNFSHYKAFTCICTKRSQRWNCNIEDEMPIRTNPMQHCNRGA
jgi:hypothetical protein